MGYIFVDFIEPAQSQSTRTGKWQTIGCDFLENENQKWVNPFKYAPFQYVQNI